MRNYLLSACLLFAGTSAPHAGAEAADEWVAEVCDGVAFGGYGTQDIVAELGAPEDCYGSAEDDPEFGPYGEVTAIWPQVTFIHRGMIPYPSAANRIEFPAPSPLAAKWIANAKQRTRDMDWSTDHDPSDQIEEYADPIDGTNRIFRIEYDQDGSVVAFTYSSLH